jgi:hypothetical protein
VSSIPGLIHDEVFAERPSSTTTKEKRVYFKLRKENMQ